MRAIQVIYKNDNIDTIFWNGDEDLTDIKKSLVEHDGYDWDIEVEEEVDTSPTSAIISADK